MYDSDGLHWVVFWFSFRIVFCIHVLEMHVKHIIDAFYLFPTIRFSFVPQFSWTTADQQFAVDHFNSQFHNSDSDSNQITTIFWRSLLPALIVFVIIQIITGFVLLLKKKPSRWKAVIGLCNWLIFVGYGVFFFGESCIYNNHHYLYLLLWFIYCITQEFVAVESQWRLPSKRMISLLRFQVAIVYLYAGVAKLSSGDWVFHFQPVKLWFWTGTPFRRSFLWRVLEWENGAELLHTAFPDLQMVGNTFLFVSSLSESVVLSSSMLISHSGLLLDFLGGLLLLFNGGHNKFVLIGFWIFHLMNASIFDIGTFPWMMLGTTFLWWIPGLSYFTSVTQFPKSPVVKLRKADILRGMVVWAFIISQVLIPVRYTLMSNDVNWTNDGHYFAWRMMLNEEQELIRWNIHDNSSSSGTIYQMNSMSYDETALRIVPHQRLQMKQDPKKIQQFTREYILPSVVRRFSSALGNVSVNVDCWRSLNGDPFQRWIRPDLEMAYAPLSPLNFASHSDWLLPRIPLDANVKATIEHYRRTWLMNSYETIFFVDRHNLEWEGYFVKFAEDFRVFVVHGEVLFFTQDGDWGTTITEDSKSIRVEFQQRHYIATLSPISIWGYAFKSPTTVSCKRHR